MKPRDLASETILSLTANKARSFLTILGIVVGISSVIVMVAIGNGTKASIEQSIASAGSNLLMVMPGGNDTGMGGGPSSAGELTSADADAIGESVAGVAAVAPQAAAGYSVVAGAANTNVSVTGTTAGFPLVRSVETSMGTWFTENDDAASAKVAVLGPTTAEDLFGEGSNPVGQRIRINGEPFTVVGVTKAKGSSGMQNTDDAVYVPLRTLQRYLTGDDTVAIIYVAATSQEEMTAAQDGIEALLTARHGIAADAEPDFQVLSQQDLADTASTITGLLTVLLGSIAGISLLVGGIGIMNMMLTTVTERIREIGLRKAIGATRTDITSQFLAEAVALTVTGGIIGILLGWGVSSAISAFSTFETAITTSSIVLAVSVSTGIGILFGWYPARRAARLNPIDALRYQ
ncbi:MAG: FtsX-like permease family protein [Actinobacteria bacterium]|nr:MAG: FtsX-like permease family protein [Actinomycetota bacterium]